MFSVQCPQRIGVAEQQQAIGQDEEPTGAIHHAVDRRPYGDDEARDIADRRADQKTADRNPLARFSQEPQNQAEGQQRGAKQPEAKHGGGRGLQAVIGKKSARHQRVADAVDQRDDRGDCQETFELHIFHIRPHWVAWRHRRQIGLLELRSSPCRSFSPRPENPAVLLVIRKHSTARRRPWQRARQNKTGGNAQKSSGFRCAQCVPRGSVAAATLWRAAPPPSTSRSPRDKSKIRAAANAPYPISITGSRPIRRDSARKRLKTRSPPSAANSSGRRSANRCRSTASGVRGSTPGIAAETT